jgi:YD repeat-containing protein
MPSDRLPLKPLPPQVSSAARVHVLFRQAWRRHHAAAGAVRSAKRAGPRAGRQGGALVSYGYDNANRLTSITQGSNVVQFTYDAAGPRTALSWPSGQRTEYGYDNASRLATLTYKFGTSLLGELQYAYDAAGQRIAVGGNWARTGLPEPLASASYDAANEQVAFGPQNLTYDLNGNLTSDGTNTFVWDARSRLIGITGPAPASFVYDSLGRRRDKALNTTGTGFVYDGLNPVKGLTALGNSDILTGPGIDEYLTRTGPTGAVNVMTDALGSTIALADDAGIVPGEYTYAPFEDGASGGLDNAFQYTGRENDGTGLYYYRARYYHPQLQRFVGEIRSASPAAIPICTRTSATIHYGSPIRSACSTSSRARAEAWSVAPAPRPAAGCISTRVAGARPSTSAHSDRSASERAST